jgi:hypothetical protein
MVFTFRLLLVAALAATMLHALEARADDGAGAPVAGYAAPADGLSR